MFHFPTTKGFIDSELTHDQNTLVHNTYWIRPKFIYFKNSLTNNQWVDIKDIKTYYPDATAVFNNTTDTLGIHIRCRTWNRTDQYVHNGSVGVYTYCEGTDQLAILLPSATLLDPISFLITDLYNVPIVEYNTYWHKTQLLSFTAPIPCMNWKEMVDYYTNIFSNV